ncbi:flavin-containing monooxygenase [Mycobacterium sp. WMMD1722]|uniref:flavin-containing monooxygenase n=1 Tax=Mycobacterium sp. WMMD1722 TaxID=3404117 RepID=UPI003BF56406
MKVCVVGAGPCGLTTVKQLLDEGHEVMCFDKNAEVGGIWLRDDSDGGKTKAFDNLHLTISMKLMAYSDHPFVGGRRFYTRAQYFEYLRSYADRFHLRERIAFNSEVTHIERAHSSWNVSVRTGGVDSIKEFDAVAICSGPFKTPNLDVPGIEGFTGEVVHSAEYRDNERFRGKRVLVVGLAESGADIVREIGDVAEACTLSIRSYTYLLPRLIDGYRTTDHGTIRAHHHEICRRSSPYPFILGTFWGESSIAKAVFLAMSVIYGFATAALGLARAPWKKQPAGSSPNPFGEPVEPAKLDLGTLDTKENRDFIAMWNRRSHPDGSWGQRGIFGKNVTFVPSIVSGRVGLNDTGIQRSVGRTVFFRDSTSAEFDAIVLCTGFSSREISVGDLQVKDGNVRNLYKHFVHPEYDGTAAFIGFVRPFSGGIPVCAEMQARYFARLCSGTKRLPHNLDEVIGREKEWEEYWTALSPRHTESTPSQILYLDALAREVGCLIPMWKLIVNPKLFVQVWFGSFNPACYRIVGPHNSGSAALADLYSEPVENRRDVAFRFSLLQLLPSFVHPRG